MTGRPDIDPILRRALDAVPYQLLGDESLESARQRLRSLRDRFPKELLPDVRIENRRLDVGSDDGVAVRIYWPPDDSGPAPLLMFFHGGGFAVGDLDTHDGP